MRTLAPTVVAAAGLVAASAAAPASASWTQQRLPSGSPPALTPSPLAANARGDIAVIWRSGQHRFLAVRRAGQARFGRRIALPGRGTADRVAVLSDGTVLVGWLSPDGTRSGDHGCCLVAHVQRLPPGSRRLSAPQAATVRGTAVGPTWSLAAGPGGRAALIAGGVTLVTSRRGGVFGLPSTLGAGGDRPFVGFGGDGRGIGLWVEGGHADQRLVGAPIGRDGRVGAVRTYVPTPAGGSTLPFFVLDAGLDRRGRATAIWTSTSGMLPDRTPARVTVASGDLAGGLGPAQGLDEIGPVEGGVSDPMVDVAPSGRAVAVWRRYRDSAQQTVVAIRPAAAARFRVLAPIAASVGGVAAILSSGRGVLVHAPTSGGAVAQTLAPDGRLGPARRFAGFAQIVRAQAVGAVAAADRVTLAWSSRDGLRIATYRSPVDAARR